MAYATDGMSVALFVVVGFRNGGSRDPLVRPAGSELGRGPPVVADTLPLART